MGMRFTFGRIMLGLLMIIQGIVLHQGGFKEQLQQMKDLRSYCLNKNHPSVFAPVICPVVPDSQELITYLIYAQVILMIVSGTLLIANMRLGGLFMSFAMVLLILTRDNPMLGTSESAWRSNFQNCLRDLAVAGIGLLVFMRRKVIKHKFNKWIEWLMNIDWEFLINLFLMECLNNQKITH